MPICANCGARQPEGAAFCDECGNPMRAQPPAPVPSFGAVQARTVVASAPPAGLCAVCGVQTKPGEPFCTNCGAALDAPPVTNDRGAAPPSQASFSATVVAGLGRGGGAQEAARIPEVLPEHRAEEPTRFEPSPVAPPAPSAPVIPDVVRCTSCGAEMTPGSRFCDMCGAPALTPPVPSPVPTGGEGPSPFGAGAWATGAAPPPFGADKGERTVMPSPQPSAFGSEEGDRTMVASPPPLPSEAGRGEPPAPTLPSPFEEEQQPWSTPTPWPAPADGRTVVSSSPQPSPSGAAEEQPAWLRGWESAAPTPAPAYAQAPAPVQVNGKFVVQATHTHLPFPPGRQELLIGREDPVNGIFPEIDLTDHGGDEGGVSRKHARVTLQGGRFFIEDLNSTNHTFINRSQLGYGEQRPLNDGDEVSFGRVKVTFETL